MTRTFARPILLGLLLGLATPATAALTPAESKMSATVDAEYERTVTLLQKLVDQNSGSMNLEGVEIVGRMMRAELEPLGFKVEWKPMAAAKRSGHLIATKTGKPGTKRLLLIAHLDTVFEKDSPFQTFKRRTAEGVDEAEGPGAGDHRRHRHLLRRRTQSRPLRATRRRLVPGGVAAVGGVTSGTAGPGTRSKRRGLWLAVPAFGVPGPVRFSPAPPTTRHPSPR